MRSPIRVVCYAVNGSGIGHLVRLIGIARWMRRYAAWLRTPFEISFLASSEADTLLFREKIPCFKLPSKTAAQEGKLDKATYLAMAKQWVWHSMALLRPDLFVADTFPSGSFGELVTSLDLCKRKALILREMRGDFARKPEVQAMLPLYDSIIVPSSESECEVPISASLKGRTHYVGPIAVRERVEMFSRSAALAELGLSGDKPVVYVSAGGGGDAGEIGRASCRERV